MRPEVEKYGEMSWARIVSPGAARAARIMALEYIARPKEEKIEHQRRYIKFIKDRTHQSQQQQNRQYYSAEATIPYNIASVYLDEGINGRIDLPRVRNLQLCYRQWYSRRDRQCQTRG